MAGLQLEPVVKLFLNDLEVQFDSVQAQTYQTSLSSFWKGSSRTKPFWAKPIPKPVKS